MCALINRRSDFTPFDMNKLPSAQCPLLMPLVWAGAYLSTLRFGLRLERKEIRGIKPPYLVLATHQGFADYSIAPLALFPRRANYVSDVEGYAAFGERLYRALGCIGKRRYAPDLSVIRNIKYALSKGRVVVLYPEARHCNAGVNSLIPDNMGRLCKLLGVPVLALTAHGSYLANPFWDEEHTRKTRIQASLSVVCRKEELASLSAEELQRRIEEKLSYNEYEWQKEYGIDAGRENRVSGLHKVLYRCRSCGGEFCMSTSGTVLSCQSCGEEWSLNGNGELKSRSGELSSIPEWYDLERKSVEQELDNGAYHAEFSVNIEALPNSKGFIPLGEGRLVHTPEGFTLSFSGKKLCFSARIQESVQTEYNYRGKGMCIVLSTRDCCYYVYSADRSFNATKLQFAAEYLHKKLKRDNRKPKALLKG